MWKYINWIDEVNVVCNIQYNKHMRMRINNYMNINMIRFMVGAWRINVNNGSPVSDQGCNNQSIKIPPPMTHTSPHD